MIYGIIYVQKQVLFDLETSRNKFQESKEDLKLNLKIVDNFISDKHVKGFIKNETKSEKVQSQLTNLIIYHSETFNTDRAIPYVYCIYGLRELSGKCNRDIFDRECEERRKDCIVFKGTDCIFEMLNYVLQFKKEA